MKPLFPRYLLIVAALFLLALCSLPACSQTSPVALETMNRAMGLVEQGDFAGARTALAANPDTDKPSALLLAARGSVELAAGKYADAEPLFQAALTQDGRQLPALWGVTLCLLHRGRVYDAATMVERAGVIAPDDVRVKALNAYVALQLGRITEAALAGKTALDGGEKSPFLLETLAGIHYRMQYPQRAVEFSSLAAKCLYGADLLPQTSGVTLPLAITAVDAPALTATPGADTGSGMPASATTVATIEIAPPVAGATPTAVPPLFQIISPAPKSTLHGTQFVQAVCRSPRQIAFVVFLVDDKLRGMMTELPYQFAWEADAAPSGEHRLCVRAFNDYGLQVMEDSITVTTLGGKTSSTPASSEQEAALQQRMMTLTMPTPEPLSLYTNLGMWCLELKEASQAISALEKAAAIDPSNATVLHTLVQLYQDNGLHAISTTGEVSRGPAVSGNGQKRIALTFDDGPNPLYTPSILALLAQYDAHSTFFLVGKMVHQYPDLTLQILAGGNELANHTYNHPNLVKLSAQDILREVLLNRAEIRDVTGRNTYLFRPPGGDIDLAVTRELRALDYNVVYWSLNAGDYRLHPPAEQAAMILSRVQDGMIILLHDGPIDGTLGILPTLLAELHRRGYAMVTVSELMKDAATTDGGGADDNVPRGPED